MNSIGVSTCFSSFPNQNFLLRRRVLSPGPWVEVPHLAAHLLSRMATVLAYAAFKEQVQEGVGSEYLFPRLTDRGRRPYLCSVKKTWRKTLKRAGVPYFSLYELRHTFATRFSAGGVADHFVTLMLRQDDAGVFKRYSQAKLNMMREALDRLDRRANEHERSSGTARPN